MPEPDESLFAELHRIGSRGGGAFPQAGDLFESIIEDIYTRVLQRGDMTLDGGAHVGRHAFPMADRVGASGRVLAVEGHPKLARGLVKRARKRRLSQVEVVALAISDRVARVPFHCVATHTAYSGIEARQYDFDDKVRVIEVEATTIDALVVARRPRQLAFCKLDLEGGELRALQGGKTVMAHDRPLIIFENDQENSARHYRYSKEEWFGFFEQLNYNLFTLWGKRYGRDDWGRRDIPWYFIAEPANSVGSTFVGRDLPHLLERYSRRP